VIVYKAWNASLYLTAGDVQTRKGSFRKCSDTAFGASSQRPLSGVPSSTAKQAEESSVAYTVSRSAVEPPSVAVSMLAEIA
jgi:hypothetical protein